MADPAQIVVRGRRVQLPQGERPASVVVREGRIAEVTSYDDPPAADRTLELADDEVLLPGVVDSHVHVNDPGRSDWEGFATATRAAAAGGVTTVVDMPLNSVPPTCEPAALDVKRDTAAPQAFVDVGFWGGAIPGNAPSLRKLHDAGVFGFKCFLLPSGVEEFPPLDADQLELAMREIAAFDGLLIVHAEDAHVIETAPPFRGRLYHDFLASRPREAEHRAITVLLDLARRTGCRVHVLHVASAGALPLIRAARREGLPVTAETCPHYLTFTAEEIPDGATQFKCCPPIREAANREQLWEGLREGTIDIVVSDHSPSTPDLKLLDTGEFHDAWGGISSLQLGLSSVWTEARSRGFGLADVVRWMCRGPALQTGLGHKGALDRGCDADFVVFAPDEEFVVDRAALLHRNPVTPYHDRVLSGVVRSTWLRGARLRPEDPHAEPAGRLLTRGDA